MSENGCLGSSVGELFFPGGVFEAGLRLGDEAGDRPGLGLFDLAAPDIKEERQRRKLEERVGGAASRKQSVGLFSALCAVSSSAVKIAGTRRQDEGQTRWRSRSLIETEPEAENGLS